MEYNRVRSEGKLYTEILLIKDQRTNCYHVAEFTQIPTQEKLLDLCHDNKYIIRRIVEV